MEILIQKLDSRMSTLDFTLGLISNVIAQFMAGIQTQNWQTRSNSNESAVWIAFNKIYPYFSATDWVNVGRYAMLFAVGLLNFEAPSVSPGLSTF